VPLTDQTQFWSAVPLPLESPSSILALPVSRVTTPSLLSVARADLELKRFERDESCPVARESSINKIENEANNCQNTQDKDMSPLSASYTPEDNVIASTKLAEINLSAPVLGATSAVKTSSPLNSHSEQPQTPSGDSVEEKLSLGQASVPDYRVQPLSATQIQLLQNFSWQAFASEGMKTTEAVSVKNE